MKCITKTSFILALIFGLSSSGEGKEISDIEDGGKKVIRVRVDRGKISMTYARLNSGLPEINLEKQGASDEYKKPSAEKVVRKIIDKEGLETGEKAFWHLKEHLSDIFEITASDLNNLGYHYLLEDEVEKAIAVLQINAVAYPKDFWVYQRLGEAYTQLGDKENALNNYEKSMLLNPDNLSGIQLLK